MPKIDLTIYAENDPSIIFNLKKKVGRVSQPDDVTGALVECYVKTALNISDDDATRYATNDATRHIEIVDGAAGRVQVDFDAEDVGGPERQFYHLDVVRNGRRLTYAWGVIKKIGFS